jgi:hypothetical protein
MWGSKPPIRLASRDADVEGDDGPSGDDVGFIPVAAQGGSVVRLTGADRPWTAGGDASVNRVDAAATGRGDGTALRVDGGGELAPRISTTGPIRDTDLTRYRSLTATVMPGSLRGTDAPVRARLRLRRDERSARGSPADSPTGHRGRGEAGDPSHERTSRAFHAPQGQPIRLYWDLRGADEALLDSVTALDVVFERADRPANEEPYGRGASGVEGPVYVDSVFCSDSPDVVAAARLQSHWQQLEAGYGPHERTVTEHKTDTAESGVVRFGDDTTVPFGLTMHEDGSHTFTLDGETYEFVDGMAAVERR